MKQSMFSKQGQKGFTLLELLVVVAIIAILSVGAILAYDGLTEKAQSATAAFNTAGADQAIRNYRVVTGNYPNQWDHLVAEDGSGGAFAFVADQTYRNLAIVDAAGISSAIIEALEEVGIDEFQVREVTTAQNGVEPNLQHSEGAANDGNTEELEIEGDEADFFDRLVVVPTATSNTLCRVNGQTVAAIRADDDALVTQGATAAQNFMTKVNDNLGEDECHLVAAFGFGHDAAHSTVNSNAAIAAAPAFVSRNINPADNYARYIALFDLGAAAEGSTNITADDIYTKARLIGLLDPEGNVIDENVAAANDETQQNKQ